MELEALITESVLAHGCANTYASGGGSVRHALTEVGFKPGDRVYLVSAEEWERSKEEQSGAIGVTWDDEVNEGDYGRATMTLVKETRDGD